MKKTLLLIITLLFSSAAIAEDKLIFAIDLIRHGDRTPTFVIPKAKYDWQQGLGQLTEKGMQQEYNLGVKMRAKYVDQYHLLPAQYHHEALYVRSTNLDRTLMSAQSLLLGLYPLGIGASTLPSGFQPIPIHTIKKDEETLLIPDQDAKKFESLMQRYVYNQPEWKKKTRALQNQLHTWSEVTGFPIKNMMDLVFLSDNLFVRDLYHIPLPTGITKEDAQQIRATGLWAFTQMYMPHEVGEATAKDLLTEMNKHLLQATQENNKLKYVLYSAHDSSILMVMSALHVPLTQQPHYASDFNLALFQTPSHQYYIKTSYNDESVILPGCHADRCTLTEFTKIIQSINSDKI